MNRHKNGQLYSPGVGCVCVYRGLIKGAPGVDSGAALGAGCVFI